MDKKTVGIIVKNDYDDVLYHESSFFIEIDINKKDDLKLILKDKLSEILDKKAFRIDKVSKKISKLNLSNEGNNPEYMIMYLVKVYMYSDNSNFLPKEDILDNISMPLYKDYYLKYIIRYNKYRSLIESYISIIIYTLCAIVILDFPFEITFNITFDNFLLIMLMYVALPIFILNKFIIPSILNYLINYDINESTFKISNWIYRIVLLVILFVYLKDIWIQ